MCDVSSGYSGLLSLHCNSERPLEKLINEICCTGLMECECAVMKTSTPSIKIGNDCFYLIVSVSK